MEYVIGVDEAGRGALAGPVAVGAVMMPAELSWNDFDGLKDSKKLRAQRREEWFSFIKHDTNMQFAVSLVGAKYIDEEGIVAACRLAAHRCVVRLSHTFDMRILLDAGLSVPTEWRQEQIVRGDETIPAIALASIVAKVSRDRHMELLAEKYAPYGFEGHKGYGTHEHRRAIRKHDLSDQHRKTFCSRL